MDLQERRKMRYKVKKKHRDMRMDSTQRTINRKNSVQLGEWTKLLLWQVMSHDVIIVWIANSVGKSFNERLVIRLI